MAAPARELSARPAVAAAAPGDDRNLAPALPAQIPSLDGLRAVCILMVCVAHSVQNPAIYRWLGHLGNYGVRMFFVISGFLITTLLLAEYRRTGAISLKQFYIRRTLRIFPAFYAFVLTVIVLAAIGFIRLQPGDLAHSLTYTMNYQDDPSWHLTHTWSLSVEEQFYLLWPALVLLLRPTRALRWAMAAVLLAPLVRLALYQWWPWNSVTLPIVLGRNFQSVCDALASGCVLAGVYNRLGKWRTYRAVQAAPGYTAAVVALIAVSAVSYKLSAGVYYVLGQTLANVGGFLLLDKMVRMPASFMGRVLNTAVLRAIGRVSYSIYLWQELFIGNGSSAIRLAWPLSFVCIAIMALTSYYAVEKPFQRLRARFR